jgi:hypothetical protein
LVGTLTLLVQLSVSLRTVFSIADVSLHKKFDKGLWLLIPEEHIIKRFFDSVYFSLYHYPDRARFPEFDVCLLMLSCKLLKTG